MRQWIEAPFSLDPQRCGAVTSRSRSWRGLVADIFVSYSRLDQERVQPIVERLQSLGYSVWCDPHLRQDQAFADEVQAELDSAKAVLTVWSWNARNSTWVGAASAAALDAHKLLQVRLDGADLPAPFDALPVADMRGREWGTLEHAIASVVREGAHPHAAELPGAQRAVATPSSAGAPTLVAIALGATLLAFAGALSATINGAMTSGQLQFALTGMLGVGAICTALSAYRVRIVARSGG